MSEQIKDNTLIVRLKDGMLCVCLPTGEPISGEIFCRVTDQVGEPAYAIIKCYVKIESE